MGRSAKAARNIGWAYAAVLAGWVPVGILVRFGGIDQLWLIPLMVAGPLAAGWWLYRRGLLVAINWPEFRRPQWKRLEGASMVTVPTVVAAGAAAAGYQAFGQSVPLLAVAAGVVVWTLMWRRRRRARKRVETLAFGGRSGR